MSTTSLAERQKVHHICATNLDLTDEETRLLFEQDGPLFVSSDKSLDQLAKVIRDLKALGVLVQPQTEHDEHSWQIRNELTLPETPLRFMSTTTFEGSSSVTPNSVLNSLRKNPPRLSNQEPRTLLKLARGRKSAAWAIAGLTLLTMLAVGYLTIRLSSLHDFEDPLIWNNRLMNQEENTKEDYVRALPQDQSMPAKTFEGIGFDSGLQFEVKLLKAGELISVRVVAVPEANNDTVPHWESMGIGRVEGEPLFLTQTSARIYSGTTRAVLVADREQDASLEPPVFEVSLEVSDQGIPTVIHVHLWRPAPEEPGATSGARYLEGSRSLPTGDSINISTIIPLSAR